ncbi:DUF5686 family protein [Antarcticibacterium sp. 1MA-6-2]|uniref:DUF5686 family protein n=1 Tax=Antarcticibacterium sp. 1MA-6-2 TaxID=2908210 RepID=UPI0028830194|nr:DUF5686 family protein [Antarcticibacterium sp. 1MA-6-2]
MRKGFRIFNPTDQTWNNRDDINYSSNNPLQADVSESAPFEQHEIFKLNITGRFEFGQKYISYPDGRYNIPSIKYPTLYVAYEKGFGSSIKNYNFDQLRAAVRQEVKLGNKGTFNYNLKGGTFLSGDDIAFPDFQHFNGNQTRVGNGSYINEFLILPYYALSTNRDYFETHLEHDFKGWILGKLPLINRLNYNLILGAHILSTENNKPYSEYSVGIDNLGFGKYRLLRLDYVISNFEGNREGAFIFGLKFLGILD